MTTEIDQLTIRFPARSGYLVVGRLNAAAVGSAAGFDVEELDDLRLAVTEAITWLLVDEDAGGQVELTLTAAGARVEIVGVRTGDELGEAGVDDLVEAILGATVDDFELDETDRNQRRVRLAKSKAPVDAI